MEDTVVRSPSVALVPISLLGRVRAPVDSLGACKVAAEAFNTKDNTYADALTRWQATANSQRKPDEVAQVSDSVKRNLPYAVNEVNDKASTPASQSGQTATTGLDEQTVSSAAADGITPMVTEDATQSPVLGEAAPSPFKYAGDAAAAAEEATLATPSELKSPEQAPPGATARALAKKNTCTDNDCQRHAESAAEGDD